MHQQAAMVIIELVDTIGIEPPCLLITLGPFYKSSGDKLIVNTVHTGVVIKVVFGNFTSIVIEQITIVRGGGAQLRYSSCTAYSGAHKIGGDDGYPISSGRWEPRQILDLCSSYKVTNSQSWYKDTLKTMIFIDKNLTFKCQGCTTSQ